MKTKKPIKNNLTLKPNNGLTKRIKKLEKERKELKEELNRVWGAYEAVLVHVIDNKDAAFRCLSLARDLTPEVKETVLASEEDEIDHSDPRFSDGAYTCPSDKI